MPSRHALPRHIDCSEPRNDSERYLSPPVVRELGDGEQRCNGVA